MSLACFWHRSRHNNSKLPILGITAIAAKTGLKPYYADDPRNVARPSSEFTPRSKLNVFSINVFSIYDRVIPVKKGYRETWGKSEMVEGRSDLALP